MTSKTDFTKEEWFLLHSTPTMVGMIVMAADKSGFFGTTKEMVAVTKGMVAGGTEYPNNALIQALLREKEGPEGDPVKDSYDDLKNQIKKEGNVEQLTTDILEQCGQAANLVDAKATLEEAGEYKAWVMMVADKVASAAKEKSSKGTDHGRISAAEDALIQKIGEAMQVDSSAS